jgi:hypothetical protein
MYEKRKRRPKAPLQQSNPRMISIGVRAALNAGDLVSVRREVHRAKSIAT